MWRERAAAGAAVGLAIAAVDRWAFGGEVSPIVIVVLLLSTTCAMGVVWGWSGWGAALATWLPVPGAHAAAYIVGLPDSLHPFTPGSIGRLGAFSLAVVAAGLAGGAILRAALTDPPRDRRHGSAGPPDRSAR